VSPRYSDSTFPLLVETPLVPRRLWEDTDGMSGLRAVGTGSTADARRRPRRGYIRARILLDSGFTLFAVGAVVGLGITGQAIDGSVVHGSSSPSSVTVSGSRPVDLIAPIAAPPPPDVAPVPPPPPVAAVAAYEVSLLGFAAMLAGLATALLTALRKSRERAVTTRADQPAGDASS